MLLEVTKKDDSHPAPPKWPALCLLQNREGRSHKKGNSVNIYKQRDQFQKKNPELYFPRT